MIQLKRNSSTWAYIDQNLCKWKPHFAGKMYTKLGRFLPRSDEVSMFEADKNGWIWINFNFHLKELFILSWFKTFFIDMCLITSIFEPLCLGKMNPNLICYTRHASKKHQTFLTWSLLRKRLILYSLFKMIFQNRSNAKLHIFFYLICTDCKYVG